jgi:hypothetical protein
MYMTSNPIHLTSTSDDDQYAIQDNTVMTVVSKTTFGQPTQVMFGDDTSYYNTSTTYYRPMLLVLNMFPRQ